MIEQIQLLRNIGQFDNVSPPQGAAFTPITLIYGENGRGKTTLAAILRSLATDEPGLVSERHRLGAQQPPHAVISHSAGQSVFQNGAWSQAQPNIAIFDDAFVAANVCSGINVHSSHRQGLHELILGAPGVALNDTLLEEVRRIEGHNLKLRELADRIPARAIGPYKVDAFCNLEPNEQVDDQIRDAEKRLAAAKSADAVRQRPGFQDIALPDFDLDAIEEILGLGLPKLEAASVDSVKAHIRRLGKGGETWVSEGMRRIPGDNTDEETEVCPFCAQELDASHLIDEYRAYFSDAYEALRTKINQAGMAIKDAHAGDIQSAFERDIRTAAQAHEFWKSFAEVPEVEIDTAAIVRLWNAAREAVLEQLRSKALAPLEAATLSQSTRDAVFEYRRCISEVARLSDRLTQTNALLDIVKEQAQADDLSALGNDLAKLHAQRARFEADVASRCDAYLTEKAAKSATEARRKRARESLDQYRAQIFPAYETTINEYLSRFAASFRLGSVESVNTRQGSSASYCVIINNEAVDVNAAEGPSFRNTLSAGDRNTLALAFFFASLDQSPSLADTVCVIDDPMTSLDEHRTLRTRAEMIRLAGQVEQMIVLSHSKPFLCKLWDQADKNLTTALRINRSAVGSEITTWNVRDDSISEHDKRHELVRGYLQAADPIKEREVASALRPMLEAFLRVAYPEHFPPGQLLGPFISLCERHIQAGNQILSQADVDELRALKDYGNMFHHDTNAAWQTAAINDAELTDFSNRTLVFTSRR